MASRQAVYGRSEKGRRAKIKSRNKIRSIVLNYKLAHPCIDCGETDPVVLDFDHRLPKTKCFGIGCNVFNVGLERLLQEIEKCDVRCANCHRRRTYYQRQNNEI